MSFGIRFFLVSYTLFHLLTVALVFLSARAFAFVLLSVVVVVCTRSLPFALVCLFVSLRFCDGLHRLLLGSEATVVFVGVSCGEPGGNEQMAHSQIVVVIVFVHSCLEWMLLLCFVGVRLGTLACTAVFQLPFTIICFGMLSFAFVCFDMVAYSCLLASFSFVYYTLFHLLTFALVFLGAMAFAFILLSTVFLYKLCSVCFVCLFPCALALVCIVGCLAVRPQSYLWVFHAGSQMVTNRWRIHRLLL